MMSPDPPPNPSGDRDPPEPAGKAGRLESGGGLLAAAAAGAAWLRGVIGLSRLRRQDGSRSAPGAEHAQGLLKKTFTLAYTDRGVVRRYRLGRGTTLIGGTRECHVRINRLDAPLVHCRLERASDGAVVLFSESDDHPVLVDGRPVEFARLDGGESISLGPVTLDFRSILSLGGEQDAVEGEYSFENDFGALMMQSLRKMHWVAVSCALHLVLIFFISWLLEQQPGTELQAGFFQNGFGESLADFPLSEDDSGPVGPYEFDEPSETVFDAPEDLAAKTPLPGEDPFDPDQFGPFGMSGEGLDYGESSAIGKILNPGGGGAGILGGGKGWSEHVGRLRTKGLDVAILYDSTGSMVRLITEVRATISEMVKALDRIAPDLRISLITYKGTPEASRYVVAKTPLVNDLFELLNFMSSVEISGGSSEGYAAIDKAVYTAVNNLAWRKGTEKTIVIIGDAAPFPDTHDEILKQIRKFKGRVSTIYKSSEQTPSYLEPQTVASFRKFARAGGGDFIRYDETGEAARRIVSAILGAEWKEQIDLVFDFEERGRWQGVLDRRVESGDIDWLMKRFTREKLRPEAADALVRIGGKEVAARIWGILEKDSGSPWIVQRSVYVLRRLTNLHVNYLESSRERLTPLQLRYIKDVLTFIYGKRFPD